jgi:alpha-tubulin suppressor-like RCC1 family protein
MNSWFQTVTKEITKGFQTSIASKPILATDEEAENSEPVWYLDDAAEYVRRIAMAAYLYGGTPGEVVSFGNDEAYQLGQVSNFYLPRKTEYLPGFVRGAPLYEVRHAAAGGLHSVAITADGQVYSWGSADEGCLGRSSVDPVGDQHEGLEQCTPRVVEGFITQDGEKQDGTMVAASAGDGHTICLSAKGQTFMFGMYKDMDSGKFAHPATPNGSPKGFRERPVHVQMPQSVIAVTCGQSFNAAILADGTMVTWGKLL